MSIIVLKQAMEAGRIMEAEKIIETMGVNDFVNKTNPNIMPPQGWQYKDPASGINTFYLAVQLGQNSIVELILSKNPNLANSGAQGHLPDDGAALSAACSNNNIKLVKLLLNKMSPKVIIDSAGSSAFSSALNGKHEKILELLVENSGIIKGVNNSNSKGILYLLAEQGYYKMAGIISPEKLINMLNPQDKKACDPSIAETLYKAVFAYDVDINFHPEIAENYFRKANILYAIGKKEEAIKCYDKVIEINSDYMDRIASNIQELLAGSNSKNQHLLVFLDHIKDLKTIDTSDLEHKEAPTIKLAHKAIQQKGIQLTNKLTSLKAKVSEITEDIDALELDFSAFIKSLNAEAPQEGQLEHSGTYHAQLSGETPGDTPTEFH